RSEVGGESFDVRPAGRADLGAHEHPVPRGVVELPMFDDVTVLFEQVAADRSDDTGAIGTAQGEDDGVAHGSSSAFDDVESQPAAGSLLLLVLHVRAGF